MNNSDKILAYLENTLSQSDRVRLEGEIKKDPTLQTELDFQTEIIQGIRQARKNELKALLNNVPVGGSGFTSNLTGTHYITAALITVLLGSGLLYFWPEQVDNNTLTTPSVVEESKPEIQNLEIEKATEKETSSPVKEQDLVVQKADAKSSEKVVSGKVESTEEKVLSAEENLALVKPKALDVFDASNEPDNVELPENALLEKSDFETKFLVSRENKFKEFDFHYQFKSNTLILYGNFDDTYEILDLNKNGNRAIYLYYKGAYHALDVDQVTIIRLSALNDSTIIEQLDNLRKKEGN